MLCGLRLGLLHRAAGLRIDDARMLVLVAVDAQQFPVAAVGRIIVVIAILVMHGELAQALAFELAAAARADAGEDLERLAAVVHEFSCRRWSGAPSRARWRDAEAEAPRPART